MWCMSFPYVAWCYGPWIGMKMILVCVLYKNAEVERINLYKLLVTNFRKVVRVCRF